MYLLDKVFAEELQKEEARMVGPSDGRTIMAICRDNYQSWLTTLFPMWSRRGINCHEEIARILRENGYPAAKAETVSTCMTRLHKEKGLNKTKARRANVGVTPTPAALPVEPPSAVLEVAPLPAKLAEPTPKAEGAAWADPAWIGEEPNWRESTPLLLKDLEKGLTAWSNELENVWRHLYRLADERKFNSLQRTTSVGFQTIGADFASLWVNLSNLRRRLGMNPKGV